MSASTESRLRHRSLLGGFTLLEAMVALSIVATAIGASFALLNFTLSTTTRMQDTVQRGEAIQSAAQLVDRMNPFATPEGERLLADCAVRWTSRMQGPPKRNVVRFGEDGLFDVAMFEVTVTGLRDGQQWFSFTAKQVGFRRIAEDRGLFQ